MLSQKVCKAAVTACQHDRVARLILQEPAVSVTLPRRYVSPGWMWNARTSAGWSSGSPGLPHLVSAALPVTPRLHSKLLSNVCLPGEVWTSAPEQDTQAAELVRAAGWLDKYSSRAVCPPFSGCNPWTRYLHKLPPCKLCSILYREAACLTGICPPGMLHCEATLTPGPPLRSPSKPLGTALLGEGAC